MPFHQRSVEPRRVSRLLARDGWRPAEENGRRRPRRPVLFSSLDDVACHTLTSIIHQLSDLSRHANDIFVGIEREAGEVFRRSYRIQGRLRSLQSEIYTLDPKKVKIREFGTFLSSPKFKCLQRPWKLTTLALEIKCIEFKQAFLMDVG